MNIIFVYMYSNIDSCFLHKICLQAGIVGFKVTFKKNLSNFIKLIRRVDFG